MRMTTKSGLILFSLFFTGTPRTGWGESIALSLEPDMKARVVARLDSEDGRLSEAEMVFDFEKQAEGWYWMEFEGTYTGYVENREIGKDLEVRPGALVHLKPASISPVLTTIEEGDKTELIWAGDWSEIRFHKPVPVYFRKVEQNKPELNPLSAPAGSALPPAQPAKIIPPPPPPGNSGNSGGIAPSRIATRHVLPRHFEGILAMAKKGLGKDSPYRLEIVDETGKRIALLDTGELLVNRPLDKFLGHWVILLGEPTSNRNSKVLLIKVKTLRLK